MDLQTVWFLLIGVLLTAYAILDGFDLGVGMILPFVKGDHDRRILLNSIGPVWDGNEVWLLVGGGALFAAFPEVYATVFSGFYLPFMLLLVALIFRAAAIEFRSKEESPRWRSTWDALFSGASYLVALLTGVALSNIAVGLPLRADREYGGGFWNLFHPHSLTLGVTTIALFMMHGSIYAALKTEGDLNLQMRSRAKSALIFFGVSYGLITIATFVFAPHLGDAIRTTPVLFILPVITLLAAANIPREMSQGSERMAFISSSIVIVGLLGLFGLGIYPNLVPSNPNPELSLTIRNASATPQSLETMTYIAILGVPFVLAYTIAIYRIFGGKVDPKHLHY
ncbi:MAG: cytochrome d ubiquinol oxidase subunit II [Fimbriimonas sp.]